MSSGAKIINNNIVVFEIAGDYHIRESMKNLLRHWKIEFEVLVSGVAPIDKGNKLKEFMKEKNFPSAK